MTDSEHIERLERLFKIREAASAYSLLLGTLDLDDIEWALQTIREQAETIKRLRGALEPFANIARASTGILKPYMMMHSQEWYEDARRALGTFSSTMPDDDDEREPIRGRRI